MNIVLDFQNAAASSFYDSSVITNILWIRDAIDFPLCVDPHDAIVNFQRQNTRLASSVPIQTLSSNKSEYSRISYYDAQNDEFFYVVAHTR